MDSGIVRNFQEGQEAERDRLLADLLIERGLLTSEEAREWQPGCPPGTFGMLLVGKGRLTPERLEELERESDLREIVEAAVPGPMPEETRVRIGKYQLVHCVGKGGMGEVWKAWDGGLRRWVAVKFLRSVDLPLIQRMAREATLASQLSHPGIPRVYEIVLQPERPYIALEFIDGASLENQKRERRRAAEIVREAALAVHHAHEKGIIHRDLKPANLMESNEGRIFVTDFGLARSVEHGGTLTESGAALGTPAYMAAEQIIGTPPDPRTDVHGLGATLYSLVEGKIPFLGKNNYEIFQQVLEGRMPRLELQDDLAKIVEKATQLSPGDRYGSARELAEDLKRYLDGDPIRARPLGTATRWARRVRRHPMLTGAVALVAGAAAIGSMVLVRKSKIATRLEVEREADRRKGRADAAVQEARKELTKILDLGKWGVPYDRETFEAAVARYESWIQTGLREIPEHPPALYLLAWLRHIEGNRTAAIDLCTELLARDPANHEARAFRASLRWYSPELPLIAVQKAQGFRVEVRPYSREERVPLEAAAQDYASLPKDHEMYDLGRARSAAIAGRMEEAERIFVDIVTNRGWPPEAFADLATLELMLRAPAKARQYAASALERGVPFPAMSLKIRAVAAAWEGEWEAAVADAEKYLALRSDDLAMRQILAGWLEAAQRYTEAVRAYDRLIQAKPGEGSLWSRRSALHAKLGQLDEAVRDARQAAALRPQDPRFHLDLGARWEDLAHSHRRGKDDPSASKAFAESEKAYTAVIDLDPASREGFRGRGRIRWATNRAAEAMADFEKSGDVHPGGGRITILLDTAGMITMEFVQIFPGRFLMGSESAGNLETPVHEVTISQGFWMQKTEVTQAQWEAVMGKSPAAFVGSDLPVESVSWSECREFLGRLNERASGQLNGRKADLPTEAEWEYACRAGTTTAWGFGDDAKTLDVHAWYENNAGKRTHPVGQKSPNGWGLHDMHGNVWEWCDDGPRRYAADPVVDPRGTTEGALRAIRGGSWFSGSANTRSAVRGDKDDRSDDLGLRVVLR